MRKNTRPTTPDTDYDSFTHSRMSFRPEARHPFCHFDRRPEAAAEKSYELEPVNRLGAISLSFLSSSVLPRFDPQTPSPEAQGSRSQNEAAISLGAFPWTSPVGRLHSYSCSCPARHIRLRTAERSYSLARRRHAAAFLRPGSLRDQPNRFVPTRSSLPAGASLKPRAGPPTPR
jgi:hypothetical protein